MVYVFCSLDPCTYIIIVNMISIMVPAKQNEILSDESVSEIVRKPLLNSGQKCVKHLFIGQLERDKTSFVRIHESPQDTLKAGVKHLTTKLG